MIYLVLGMHKSGTTLISELLHHSGVNMTRDFDENLDYDSIKGKMECPDAVRINNDILDSWQVDSLDIQPPDHGYKLPPDLADRIVRLIRDKTEKRTHWGLKDPRMCLTYQYWQPYLPDHRIIFIYRNPYQVVKHYQQFYRYPKRLLSALKALRAYTLHNQMVLNHINTSKTPCLVMEYSELMSNPDAIRNISSFTNVEVTDRRNQNKYRKSIEYNLPVRIMDSLFATRAVRTYEILRKYRNQETVAG